MSSSFIETVRKSGIVGAGGAGFPAYVKYGAKADTVIANGAECEPLLYCDQTVMTLYASEITEGLKMLVKETGASRGVIALKSKYQAAVEAFKKALAEESDIFLFELGNFYPAGDEQVIVHEVTGRIVPEGGLPLNVGVIVANVLSLLNLYNAYQGTSVTTRWLTVNGAVKKPYTAELPVGISFREAIELAGGAVPQDYAVISGGPMMGKLSSPDALVTKTTSGILIFPADHPHVLRISQKGDSILKRTKSVCDQCMACTEICPRFLLGHELMPHKIMRSVAYGISETDVTTSSFLCCECGVCSYYACPLYLSPGLVNTFVKQALGAKGIKNNHTKHPSQARIYREERKLPVPRLAARIGVSQYTDHKPGLLSVNPDIFKTVRIPLKQHIGAPSIPVVSVGSEVRKGELIADIPEGKLGATVHASINGRVFAVASDYIEIGR